jgi:hypothetical protein
MNQENPLAHEVSSPRSFSSLATLLSAPGEQFPQPSGGDVIVATRA